MDYLHVIEVLNKMQENIVHAKLVTYVKSYQKEE